MPEVIDPPAAPAKSPFHQALEAAINPPEPVKEAPAVPDAAVAKPAPAPAESKEVKPESPAKPAKSGRAALFDKKPAEAPATEPAKPEEPKSAIDSIAEPEHKDEKGKSGWQAIKSEAKKWETKAAQYEKEIADRKAAGRDAESLEARLAEKEKQLTDYAKVAERASAETRPGFIEKFVDGRQAKAAAARAIVEEASGDVVAFDAALYRPPKDRSAALREILSEMQPYDLTRINPILHEIGELDKEAAAIREQPQKFLAADKEQQIQEEAEARAQFAKKYTVTRERTLRELRGEIEVLNKIDGDDEWNADVDKIHADVDEFFQRENSLEEGIKTRAMARAMPLYRKFFLEEREAHDVAVKERDAKIADMEKELKAIHSKSPSLSGRGAAGDNGLSDSQRPYSERVAAAIG